MLRAFLPAIFIAITSVSFAAPRSDRAPSNPLRTARSHAEETAHEEPLFMEEKEPEFFTEQEYAEDPLDEFADDPSCGVDEFEQPRLRRVPPNRHRLVSPLERIWERTFGHPWFVHRDPNDPGRHRGIGDPLRGTSWRNRPHYVSAFVGGLIGDDLQANQITQDGGTLTGLRLGSDFDHFWGLEIRFALSDVGTAYAGSNRAGQCSISLFDANLLYYPFGDARWRPYVSVGFGLGTYDYQTLAGRDVQATAIAMPLGIGLKYLISGNWAIRFDVTDNLTFPVGDRVDLLNNVSFTGGVELHFGGRGRHYGPWK